MSWSNAREASGFIPGTGFSEIQEKSGAGQAFALWPAECPTPGGKKTQFPFHPAEYEKVSGVKTEPKKEYLIVPVICALRRPERRRERARLNLE